MTIKTPFNQQSLIPHITAASREPTLHDQALEAHAVFKAHLGDNFDLPPAIENNHFQA